MKRLITIGLLVFTQALSAATITITPTLPNINLGDLVTLNVIADAGTVGLYGYQYSLGFDPAALQAISVNTGGLLGVTGNFSPGTINNTSGSITFVYDFLAGASLGVSGPGTLASVVFRGIGVGPTSVGFLPASDLVLSDSDGLEIVSTGVGANVQVLPTAVPEPASLGGVLLGLAAGLAWKRRRSARLRESQSPAGLN